MGVGGEADGIGESVRRLRLTYLATRVHDKLREIGEPEAFAARLVNRAPVLGLKVSLPFGPGLAVDNRFWSAVAERGLDDEPTTDVARALRRAGIPLRHRAGLEVEGVETPRLEAHIHPFGVVTLTAVDVLWSDPVAIVDAWQRVASVEDHAATVTVGGTEHPTTLVEAAGAAADALLDILGTPGAATWRVADHRLATAIEGTASAATEAMPPARGPVHTALHRLSRGGAAVAEPGRAFVAQWSGADFAWAPGRLVYMLDAGTSVVAADAGAGLPVVSLGGRHRHLTLLLAHVMASVGLIRAAPTASSRYFSEWAKKAADRLGRLYGPAVASDEWGLETRMFLTSTGAVADVEAMRGSPLVARYPAPPYP